MKRHPVVESTVKSSFLGEENLLRKVAEKAWSSKGSRWEAEGLLGTLPSHSLGNNLCLSLPHVSEPCLCGCSLRTKLVLHPRPPPVSRPISQLLPNVSSGRKPQSSSVTAFRAQLSHSSPKPKAKTKSQRLSWSKSQVSCNARALRKPVPMSVWPQGFLNPLSKTLSEESLHPNISLGGTHPSRQGAKYPVISLEEQDKS